MSTPIKKITKIDHTSEDHKAPQTSKGNPATVAETMLHDKEAKHLAQVAAREEAAKQKADDAQEKLNEDNAQKHIHELLPQTYDLDVQNPHAAL